MKTSITKAVLPENISNPNALTSYYSTNVLYPKIGPLAVSRHVRLIAKLIRDYASAMNTVRLARDFQEQYQTPVQVIEQPLPWLKEQVVYKASLGEKNNYLSAFVVDLSAFRSPLNTNNATKVVDGKQELETPILRGHLDGIIKPIIIAADTTDTAGIAAITDITAGELLLIKDRVIANPVQPKDLMGSKKLKELLDGNKPIELTDGLSKEIVSEQERAYKLGNIMHGISRVNGVMPDLIDAGIVHTKGELVDSNFTTNDYLMKSAAGLAGKFQVQDVRLKVIGALVDQAVKYLEELGLIKNNFIKFYRKDPTFRLAVQKYLIGKIDHHKPIDSRRTPLPSEAAVLQSREWAFQRQEKLELFIKKPLFRGPFNADSVSPKSELTISESAFMTQFSGTEALQASGNSTLNELGSFTSDRFKSELSNMTESGVMDEASFSNESTLLNTLRERRRETINRTLTNISNENQEKTTRGFQLSQTNTRSYRTEGKDDNHSTTELSFQVVTPVDVKVSLEEVNLVWAPHIPSPFLNLHRIIRRHRRRARRDFITQNYIIDPVRPIEIYEEAIIEKEFGFRGRHRYQTGTFDYLVDSRFQGNGWELDTASSQIDFRNGTGDDYNWDEAWNWDDLENWDTYYQSLEQDGNRIKGIAVLETTDPEYFNRGFLTFRFAMRRLTEASKAALRVYENDQAVAAAEQRAVDSRANQYAKLKQDELIRQYTNRLDLQEEVFDALIRQVFQGQDPEHYSYYKEIIRSCINWSEAGLQFDSNDSVGLPFPEFSRSHFMNTTGVRLILPILKNAEDNFITTVKENGGSYYVDSFKKVSELTDDYRQKILEFKANDPAKLVLDSYQKDVVIGSHLEAVISNHAFTSQA